MAQLRHPERADRREAQPPVDDALLTHRATPTERPPPGTDDVGDRVEVLPGRPDRALPPPRVRRVAGHPRLRRADRRQEPRVLGRPSRRHHRRTRDRRTRRADGARAAPGTAVLRATGVPGRVPGEAHQGAPTVAEPRAGVPRAGHRLRRPPGPDAAARSRHRPPRRHRPAGARILPHRSHHRARRPRGRSHDADARGADGGQGARDVLRGVRLAAGRADPRRREAIHGARHRRRRQRHQDRALPLDDPAGWPRSRATRTRSTPRLRRCGRPA